MNPSYLSKNVVLSLKIFSIEMNYNNSERNFYYTAASLGADVSLGKLSEENLYLCQSTLACNSFPKLHTTSITVNITIFLSTTVQ